MPDDEKDKYDELEELSDIEAELEELPVEAMPEPLGEVTEPMDNLQQKLAEEKAVQEPPDPETSDKPDADTPPEETSSDLGKKIEAAAKVKDASEYLKGQKQVKVIKKSAIKLIIDEIIQQYSGVEHKDLISKIAEYELNFSNLREQNALLKQQVEQLLMMQKSVQEDTALKYEKELEEMRKRLSATEELLQQDSSKENVAKLEEEVIFLRQRVKELEAGLEFAAIVENYDYGMAMESAIEQGQKIVGINETIDKALEAEPESRKLPLLKDIIEVISRRYEFLSDIFKESQFAYSNALKKIEGNEGSIEMVAKAVRLNAKNQGWSNEMNVCERFLEAVEASVKGK